MIRWAIVVLACGCYHGAEATRDVNAAWRGHARAELQATWGAPVASNTASAAWSYTTTHVELPSATGSVSITSTSVDIDAAARPGLVEKQQHVAIAQFDPSEHVVRLDGPSLHWGPPRDENLRWGLLFGAHVGMGLLDDAKTPLPSGGAYIGGMLGPRLGLVGTFSMVSGIGDGGGAIGFAWGMGLQYWATTRFSLRAGPAFVLAMDPGFDNVTPTVGGNVALSLGLIRGRVFVLDVRADSTVSPEGAFASLGVGVNIN